MGFFGRKRGSDRSRPDMYETLRMAVLHLTPEQLGDAFAEAPILALLMETGYPQAVVTLVGSVDGASSLYFSGGGGVLGAGSNATLAEANARWLEAGVAVLPQLSVITDPPPPKEGTTQFVAVTPKGVLAASALQDELGEGRHELSPLFYAAQDVITQIRLTQPG